MKKNLKIAIVFVYVILSVGIARAFEPNFVVYVDVKNDITRHKMDYVRCYLQAQDSIDRHWGLAQDGRADIFQGTITVSLTERPKPGKYRIYVRKMLGNKYDERYETGYVPVEVPEDAKSGYRMPTFYVKLKQPKERELKEVTVTATKVKFYHKGDTLVYNADAFLLANGSMLDGLLNQMPGVELKSNGIIYCNGKRVQQLLLNGKDVFNGKFGEMLDNLPAYTVKDIAVYDKRGRISEMMGMQTGDANYVMDVRLKREYAHGVMANGDAGYGTENRYLARLFGLWYSDNVSVSANAIANNLSDSQRAGEKDNVWSASQMSKGLFSTHGGGINYLVKGSEDKWELKGTVDVGFTDYDDRTASETEYFNEGNSTFTYTTSNRNEEKLRIKTNHEFLCNINSISVVKIKPWFGYNNNKNTTSRLTASFRNPVTEWNADSIENIYSPSSSLAADVINRMKDQEQNKWNTVTAGLEASGYINLNSSGRKNMLMIQAASNYSSDTENAFSRYSVNFGDNPVPQEVSHRYYKDSPNYHLESQVKVEFTRYFRRWSLRLPISYQFRYTEDKKDSRAYTLEQLADYGYLQYPLDFLPSPDVLADILNPQLSYQTLSRHYIHSFDFYCDNLSSIYLPKYPGRYLSFILSGGANLHNQIFDYRHIENKHYNRNDFTYDLSLYTALRTNQSNAWQYSLRMSAASVAPNLNAVASLPTRDPLEIQSGASSLKQTHSFDVTFTQEYNGSNSKKHTLFAYGMYESRPSYVGIDINQSTGIQTLTQANGRFRIRARLGYDLFMPLRRNSPFTISSSTSAEFKREVLNTGLTTANIQEKLKLGWQYKTLRLSVFAHGNANSYTRSYQTSRINTLDLKYGLDGLIKLPYNWEISTDFTIFTRRGYLNPEYNTTEPVWSMHTSKSLLKGTLILSVDAYDILHQISNITNIQTTQYRTETTQNGVPAYILFHIRYLFHRSPKHH